MLRDTGRGLREEFGADLELEVSDVVPLEPHEESENLLGYSMFFRETVSTGGGSEVHGVAVTSTLVLVSGKVLFLYCYGPKEDLEWTRKAAGEWARAILACNPLEAPRASRLTAIDWADVAADALTGAAVALLTTLLAGYLVKRRKNRTPDPDNGPQ